MIEPELREAVEQYFDKLKAAVLKRLELGEDTYRGQWKRLSTEQIRKERWDEMLDVVAYSIFLDWREDEG